MKSFPILLLVLVSLCFNDSQAFTTTKKRERRHAFKSAPGVKESKDPSHEDHASASSMFALPPASSTAAAISVHEDEVDVSYGVAMVSCVLSLALGFGFGYGT
jgi:hypothetical protein